MEAVRAFNNELSSLYEARPPISRAKMANVTKCAIKAIKFYKHVVQSVEKFIQKCKPEYKVPGLYVIDSIIRQSRHQYGLDKDAFAPRFTKNIVSTFQNLFKCPPDERSKVIRVLNLWQKNNVLPVDVIQPLLDLAADPNNVDLVLTAQRAVEKVVTSHSSRPHGGGAPHAGGSSKGEDRPAPQDVLATQNDMLATVTKLLQQTDEVRGPGSLSNQQQQLHQLQVLQQQLVQQTELMQKPQESGPLIDNNLLAQIQTLTNQLLSKTSGDGKGPPEPGGFNKKLLDFDYGESDDEDDRREGGIPGNVQNILNDPAIMQHIHQMSQTLQKSGHLPDLASQEQLHKKLLLQQQEQFDKEIGGAGFMGMGQFGIMNQSHGDEMDLDTSHDDKRDDHHRSSHRSRDRSRSPKKRKRSRSRSRERKRRSRSRERHRRSRSRDRDKEKTKEKEKDRRKKGLPAIKEKHVSVCSTTLWIGHISKYTTEEEIREEIEKYGVVESVNMIPPRGCAYVCMTKRKDAYRSVDKMSKGCKINGSTIRIAFAPGIGVKGVDYKEGWNAELGVTYIPWNKLPIEINPLCEGGMIDEDSLPAHLRGMKFGRQEEPDQDSLGPANVQPDMVAVQMQQQAMQAQQGQQGQPGQPGHPQFGGPMPGVVPVMQPHLMPPVMMPVPGQMPPGQMPPGQLPPGVQPGQIPQLAQGPMPGQIPGQIPGGLPHGLSQIRLPQGLPPHTIPHSTLATFQGPIRPQMTVVSLGNKPLESASAQLSQAINNIMSTSSLTPGIQQPPHGAPRPGFPPRPGNFNFNPQVPPPNFRLPGMPGTPIRLPFGGMPTKPADDDSDGGMDWSNDKEPEDKDERVIGQVPPGFPRFAPPGGPNMPTSQPMSLPSLIGSPLTRGPRPLLQQSPQIPGMQPRPQITLGQRPALLQPGEQQTILIQGPPGSQPRQPGPGGLPVTGPGGMQLPNGPRGPNIGLSPQRFPGGAGAPGGPGGPGVPRPGLLGFRPGHPAAGFRFNSPQVAPPGVPPGAPPGAPPNFRGPRPLFGLGPGPGPGPGPNPEMDRPFQDGPPGVDGPGPEFNHGDKMERFGGGRPPPLLSLDDRDRWNSNDRGNSMDNMQGGFGRRERDFEDNDEFEENRFGQDRDMGRGRGRDFRGRDREQRGGFGQGGQFMFRNDRSLRNDRSGDRERDRDRDRDRERDRDRDFDRDRDRDRDRGRRGRHDERDWRDRNRRSRERDDGKRSRDRPGRQSRWSAVNESAEAPIEIPSDSEVPPTQPPSNENQTQNADSVPKDSTPSKSLPSGIQNLELTEAVTQGTQEFEPTVGGDEDKNVSDSAQTDASQPGESSNVDNSITDVNKNIPTSNEPEPYNQDQPTPEQDANMYDQDQPTPEQDANMYDQDQPTPEQDANVYDKDQPTPEEDANMYNPDQPTTEQDSNTYNPDQPTTEQDSNTYNPDQPTAEQDTMYNQDQPTPEQDANMYNQEQALYKDVPTPEQDANVHSQDPGQDSVPHIDQHEPVAASEPAPFDAPSVIMDSQPEPRADNSGEASAMDIASSMPQHMEESSAQDMVSHPDTDSSVQQMDNVNQQPAEFANSGTDTCEMDNLNENSVQNNVNHDIDNGCADSTSSIGESALEVERTNGPEVLDSNTNNGVPEAVKVVKESDAESDAVTTQDIAVQENDETAS